MAGAISSQSQSDQARELGAFKWVLVAALFCVSAVNYADRSSITAVFPLLRSELGFTDVGLGAIGSFFLWSYALASPFAGYAGDRVNRSLIIVGSLAGWSLVTALAGFTTAPWQLLGMRLLLGVVEAMYIPAGMALVAEYHGSKTRGTALGLLSVGNYVGLLGGGTAGGYLGEHYGWRSPLWVLGAAGILLAGICCFILPIRKRTVTTTSAPPVALSFPNAAAALFRIPSFIVLMVAGVLTSIGGWIFTNWLPLYFNETFSMTLASAGFFGASLVPASSAIAQAVAGPVSDFIGRKGLHYRMLLQAILIFCAAPTLVTFLVTHNRQAIMVALVLYAIFRSSADLNIIPLLCDLGGKDKTATAFGITNMVNTIAGGLGIFFAGVLKANLGLAAVFGAVAGILTLDAILLFGGYALLRYGNDSPESGPFLSRRL